MHYLSNLPDRALGEFGLRQHMVSVIQSELVQCCVTDCLTPKLHREYMVLEAPLVFRVVYFLDPAPVSTS
jgi:hypothetical protein